MEPNEKKTAFKLFSLEAGIVIVIILIILGILSFLGIIPFSFFNSTPPQSNNINKTPTTTTIDDTGYGCIFSGKLCTQGETITTTDKIAKNFYGIGFTKIPSGTPIKAVISGRIGMGVATDAKTGTKINTLSITNDSLHVEADYSYTGKPMELTAGGGNISKRDIVGWIGDGSVTFRQDPKTYSLIFYVLDLTGKNFKQLKFSDFK